jgi:NAD-dependent oxidoreductase involved in siderophore biosynthesis
MLIAVAGPYSAATQEQRQRNLDSLNEAAAAIFKLGHIPLIGVNAALPVAEWLDPDSDRYEAMMTISLAMVDKCDAILMIGSSPGANRERDLVEAKGLPVYKNIDDIPAAS